MARKSNVTPSYLPHKQSGRARLVWTDLTGVRQQKLLPGKFGTRESLAAKARLELEIATSPTRGVVRHPDVAVAEVLAAYMASAQRYYRGADGNPTKELHVIRYALKPVRELYACLPANEFGPRALAAVRQQMVAAGLARTLINRRIGVVKRAIKWAVSEELLPPASYESLRSLAGLRLGRTDAKESDPVKPVPDDVLAATLPYLPQQVRMMIELMSHTGMRASETCGMTLGQIDCTREVWLYWPTRHKTAHHGNGRTIPLGPSAKGILSAHLAGRTLAREAPIFSPAVAQEERFAQMRVDRKSKVQPSQDRPCQACSRLGPADDSQPARRARFRACRPTCATPRCGSLRPPTVRPSSRRSDRPCNHRHPRHTSGGHPHNERERPPPRSRSSRAWARIPLWNPRPSE